MHHRDTRVTHRSSFYLRADSPQRHNGAITGDEAHPTQTVALMVSDR